MINGMRIRTSGKFLFLILVALSFQGCKKNQLGGKSTISGSVMHHSGLIPHARVFIKFNATEFPGPDTTRYDSKTIAGADAKYSFSTYKGDYYLYAVGFDPGIKKVVNGGVPVRVRNKENVHADLAVTED
jgi:hypothetical protein